MRTLAACLCAGALAGAGPAAMARPTVMSLQVERGELRAAPSLFSAAVGSARYGDRLTVQEERDGWSRVTTADGSVSGWLHASALTRQALRMSAAGADAQVAASSGEVALAGKGFNSQVEAEFKARNKDVDFAWIDRMEQFKVAPAAMLDFLKAGGLAPAKGGAR